MAEFVSANPGYATLIALFAIWAVYASIETIFEAKKEKDND